MKQCFAYIRVSTVKQGEGVSLEAQQEAITRFASQHNLSIIQWFEEKETAAKCGRPQFNKMVRELRNGRANGLIIHKIDRSARNLADWARIGDLADAGIDIHFATESLDFRSRGGRLAADVQAVVAADYIRNLRDECIKGLNGRLKQGYYPFRAPIGYLDNGRAQPKTFDPLRAGLVREAFELYASRRHSLRSLRAELQKRGLTNRHGGKLTLRGLETILRNPFYTGVIFIRRTGATFQGNHEPLISAHLFQRVQDIKSGKAGPKVTRHNHLYQGLFRCGACDGPMVPERQKGTVYYRCQRRDCITKTVREDQIAASIRLCLANAELTEQNAKDACLAIRGWVTERKNQNDDQSLVLRESNLQSRKARLTDALVDGMIEREDYKERHKALVLEEQMLREERAAFTSLYAKAENLHSVIELTRNLTQGHDLADRQQRRAIVEMTTSNRTVTGKNVYIEPQDWLQGLKGISSVPSGEPSRDRDRTFRGILRQFTDRPVSRARQLDASPKSKVRGSMLHFHKFGWEA